MITGALFDLDGTILDSMDAWETLGEDYLSTLGLEPYPGLSRELYPMSMEEAAAHLKKAYDLPMSIEEIIDGINNTVFSIYKNTAPAKEGIIGLLDYLKAEGVPMVIASLTDRYCINAALERLNIGRYFERIFTASEVGRSKTDPLIYLKAAESINSPVPTTFVFEDSFFAARTAKAAGFFTVGVYDISNKPREEEMRRLCDVYLDSFTDYSVLKPYFKAGGKCMKP